MNTIAWDKDRIKNQESSGDSGSTSIQKDFKFSDSETYRLTLQNRSKPEVPERELGVEPNRVGKLRMANSSDSKGSSFRPLPPWKGLRPDRPVMASGTAESFAIPMCSRCSRPDRGAHRRGSDPVPTGSRLFPTRSGKAGIPSSRWVCRRFSDNIPFSIRIDRKGSGPACSPRTEQKERSTGKGGEPIDFESRGRCNNDSRITTTE